MEHKEDLQKLFEYMETKICYVEESVEVSILAMARRVKSLFRLLSRIGEDGLLQKAESLKKLLITRYKLVEKFFLNDLYYHVTLGWRLRFAEVLKANSRVVQRHYYSNCVPYPDFKSSRHTIFTLTTRLKILHKLSRRMVRFDDKMLQELSNIVELSERDVHHCLLKLLKKSTAENAALQKQIKKQQAKARAREVKISRFEKLYFSQVVQKLNSEKWQEQEEIRKKTLLHGKYKGTVRKRILLLLSCNRNRINNVNVSDYKFMLKMNDFEQQIADFYEANINIY